MRIVREALAGTLESSDALVRVAPADTFQLDIRSAVFAQYGDDIRAVVEDQLSRLGVATALVSVEDKGALEFVLRARVAGAVRRASDETPAWSTR